VILGELDVEAGDRRRRGHLSLRRGLIERLLEHDRGSPFGDADAAARMTTRDAVISPPNRLSESTSLVPVPSDVLTPVSVEALAETACVVATDPSVG
jgi:hypothetical protein